MIDHPINPNAYVVVNPDTIWTGNDSWQDGRYSYSHKTGDEYKFYCYQVSSTQINENYIWLVRHKEGDQYFVVRGSNPNPQAKILGAFDTYEEAHLFHILVED